MKNRNSFRLTGMLFSCLLLFSCSKSIYYAWEGENWGYCTLEIKKYEVIYRGSAFPYFTYEPRPIPCRDYFYNIYVYISDKQDKWWSGAKRINNLKNEYGIGIRLNNSGLECYTVDFKESKKGNARFQWRPFLIDYNTDWAWNVDDRDIAYVFYEDSINSLSLVEKDNMIIANSEYMDTCVKDSVLLANNINWFPHEMQKVKKIDYKKFPREIQKLNLKNPSKEKK